MIEEVYNIEKHVYQDVINVVFTDDIKASIKGQCKLKKIKYRKFKTSSECSAVFCDVSEKNYSGMWLIFDIKHINDGIIVHEVVHVSRALAHSRGLGFNGQTEEAYAYLIQWLFNQVKGYHQDFLSKQESKRKKKNKKV